MVAIEKCFSAAGLLHRDISVRNVMLTSDGRGILNDWDHAGPHDQDVRRVVSLSYIFSKMAIAQQSRLGHLGIHVHAPPQESR